MRLNLKTSAILSFFLLASCNRDVGDNLPELMLMDGLFPPEYTVGGTVIGLAGTLPLQLTDESSGNLTEIAGNGIPTDYSFTLNGNYRTLDTYSISIAGYPDSPLQVCDAVNNTGEVVNDDLSVIQVDCITAYRLYLGAINGVTGSGLEIVNNGVNFQKYYSNTFAIDPTMSGAAAQTYQFSEPLGVGGDYSVTIGKQPTYPWQTCSFSAAADGTSVSTDITLPDLTCQTNSYELSATTSNLQYAGLEITLATDGGAPGTPVAIPVGSPTYSFGNYLSGTRHTVAISNSPPGQTCSVSGSPGTIAGGNVNVQIICADPTGYPVSGTILASSPYLGSGLELTLTITHLDSTTTTTIVNPAINSPGTDSNFVFPIALVYGEDYSVKITSQPTGVMQDCDFSGGGGQTTVSGSSVTGPITLPDITCITRKYSLSGNITGLSSAGAPALAAVGATLYINGSAVETIGSYNSGSSSMTFSFSSYDSGSTYSLVPSHHQGLKCVAGGGSNGNGTGTIGSTNVTDLTLDCDVRFVYNATYIYGGMFSSTLRYGSLVGSVGEGTITSSSTSGINDMVSFPDGSDWIYTNASKTTVLYTAGTFNTGTLNCNPATYVASNWIVYSCYSQYAGATDWNYKLYSQKADGSSGEVAVETSTAVNSRYVTLIPGSTPRIAWAETTEPANDTPIIKACDFNTTTGVCSSTPTIILAADVNRTGILGLTTSPDGTKMLITAAYASTPEPSVYEWTIGNSTATPGAGMTLITTGYDAAYHPSGNGFLFSRSDPDTSVYYHNFTTNTETRLIAGNTYYDYRGPSFYFKPD